MSVFRVKLNNTAQGLMDVNVSNVQFATSHQRTVYIMGPNKINRLLNDGETFTDCNYWKRFAYPQVSLENAFIEVVTDDGSVYSDIPEENKFGFSYSIVGLAGSAFAANVADIVTDHGGAASFVQIHNTHATDDVNLRLNGDVTLTLAADSTQVFNNNDLPITLIEFAVPGANPVTVEIVGAVRSVCLS